jgi:beta-lactam-binding protein with PASTA domain
MKSLFDQVKAFVLSKYFLKQLGLVVLFYLSIVFIMMLYLRFTTQHGERIEVPNLIGKSSEQGRLILEDMGLKYQIMDSVYVPQKPSGTILSQSPGPTTKTLLFVKSGRTISLQVSKRFELREMPDLINRQIRFAERSLKQRGFLVSIRYKPTNEANGSVLDVLYKGRPIKKGLMVPVRSTITLIVGANDQGEPVMIPNLYGISYSDARFTLDTLGVPATYICSDCITSEDSLASRVIIQSPEFIEGQSVPKSTPFTIHLRKAFNEYIENENQ